MSELQFLNDYVAGCGALRAAFLDMSREQLDARPIAGKWSAMEVLCHIVDMDLMAAARIRLALLDNNSHVPGVSPEEMTLVLAAHARDASEEVTLFATLRTETVRILRGLPADALDRTISIHKTNGDVVKRSVQDLITGITGHALHHLAFVDAKRQALGLAPVRSHEGPTS